MGTVLTWGDFTNAKPKRESLISMPASTLSTAGMTMIRWWVRFLIMTKLKNNKVSWTSRSTSLNWVPAKEALGKLRGSACYRPHHPRRDWFMYENMGLPWHAWCSRGEERVHYFVYTQVMTFLQGYWMPGMLICSNSDWWFSWRFYYWTVLLFLCCCYSKEKLNMSCSVRSSHSWGWVIVLSALVISLIVDGLTYTFGVFLGELERVFQEPKSTISLASSLQVGLYLFIGE